MAFDPWKVPHECEKQELWRLLEPLKPQQRKVLRSYIRNVEFGEMSLTAWAHQERVPRVSLAVWRKPFDKGGNYWGTEESPNMAFRDAFAAYVHAYGRWQTEEEEKSIRAANRELRLGALNAARRITDLVDNADKDETKLNAAKTVLDRASADTAEKSNIAVDLSADTFAALRGKAAAEAEELEEEALEEWQP